MRAAHRARTQGRDGRPELALFLVRVGAVSLLVCAHHPPDPLTPQAKGVLREGYKKI
jgi:hypothetical protein